MTKTIKKMEERKTYFLVGVNIFRFYPRLSFEEQRAITG